MSLESIDRKEKLSATKLHVSQYVVAAVLLVLGCWLWRLQILGADQYRVLAEQNRVRKVPVLAPRGRIFDRYGRILVDNYPSVTCFLIREQQKSLDADLPLISEGLHIPLEQIQATLRHFQYAPKYQPIPLKQDITPDEQAFIAAHRDDLPELETLDTERRLYPKDGFAAHLIGYVGEVSEADLNDERFAAYQPGDVVGKFGVEETYDAILRGTDGSRDIIVNSHGKEVGQMGQELAIPGKDLHLTIDLDLQMAAERALEGKNGAIVAMDPHTGEILAMVSRPTFDPNEFAVRLSSAYWKRIMEDPNHPMMNKAIQAQLPPGSTFKVVMTLAGLQENVAQDMHVECNGGATFYGHFFGCDRHHGFVDIHNALPYSCDTFYYTLANKLGIETIAKYAHSVGFGAEDGDRSTGRAGGRGAERGVEAEDAARQVVCGRDDFGGDRTGGDAGDADAGGAGAERDCFGRRVCAAACADAGPADERAAGGDRSGVSGLGRGAYSADSGELGDDYGRYGERVEPDWDGGRGTSGWD